MLDATSGSVLAIREKPLREPIQQQALWQVCRRGAISSFPICLLLHAPILSDDGCCKTLVGAAISMLDATSHAGSSRSGPLLSAVSISKRYGDFLANDGIDLDLFPAEIHALLGENGAGKSTLVKTMYGLIQPSGGELRWMGQKIVLAGPSEARDLGIGMVFQHFTLFENLNVAENVALGLPATNSFAAISERLEETARVYGLPLNPKREVWQLSVGERQRIEIVRALMQNPKLLILDEPTSVLTPQEADLLFVVLERLKGEGRTILYISHKLEEVKRLCDTATILRGGKKVATCNPRQETAASLARMMVGAEIGEVKAASGRGARCRGSSFTSFRSSRTTRMARGSRKYRLKSAAARSWALPASPATARTNCFQRCPANVSLPRAAPLSSTARRPACSASPTGAAWAPPSCRRNGWDTAPRRA